MNNLEMATWGLAIFTGLLVIATGIYAYLTYKMLKSSAIAQKLLEDQNSITKEQIEIARNQETALNKLSSNLVHLTFEIGNLPYTEEEIKHRKEVSKEITERRKQHEQQQRQRALRGR